MDAPEPSPAKSMTPLQKRLAVSAVLVAITIWAIFFSPVWIFVGTVEIFCLLAVREYFLLAQTKGIEINLELGLTLAAALPISIYYRADSAVLAAACMIIFIWHFHPRYREQALVRIAVTFFGLIYVVWFFSHLIKIRNLEHGAAWVFYTILMVKGGDAGAYFVGKKYGKTKLIDISPKKTVEGSIGCCLTTIVLSVISKFFLPHVPVLHLVVLGSIVSVMSQCGDLAESLIKRDAGVKDSGEMPGLGGMLDVLDSLILTIPFIYYYIIAFPSVKT